ncbi:serine protease grass-like [Drosophila gunungcola]|uniref:serine protease grass-like n=1 Tax=Drosophila gunungcola TaxID=103775 RepID=UPI0022E94690|nr:serine protease grass-like [Drosophila gunungcola]
MTRRAMKSYIAGLSIICSLWLQESHSMLLEENCGAHIGARISNGVNAGLATYPWMAYLHTLGEFKCAGTLVNHWFVLTAAQCIPDDVNITVRLGEYNRETKKDCLIHRCTGPALDYDVDMAFEHTLYKADQHVNDIGMLRLGKRVEYLVYIRPICFFVNERAKSVVNKVTWFTATGWGKTAAGENANTSSILQELKINRRPKELCSGIFGRELTSEQICAGNDDSNLCNGDTGGPLIRLMKYRNEYRFVQLGIATWMNNQCQNASVITDLMSHGDWIKRVVRQFGPPGDVQRPLLKQKKNNKDELPIF